MKRNPLFLQSFLFVTLSLLTAPSMFRICKAQISNKRLSQLKVVFFFFFTLYDLHRIKGHLCVLWGRGDTAINKVVCVEISSGCHSLNSSSFILQNIEYPIPIYVIIHLSTQIWNMSTHIWNMSTHILNLSTQYFELSTQLRKWVLHFWRWVLNFWSWVLNFKIEYSTVSLNRHRST